MNASVQALWRVTSRWRSHTYWADPGAQPTSKQFEFKAISRHEPLVTEYHPCGFGPAWRPKYWK
jgi:hypothetical protein